VLAQIRRRGGKLVRRHGSDWLIRLPARIDSARECARLARLSAVDYAEPDHVIVGRALKAAVRKPAHRIQPALTTIRAAAAWRLQAIDRSTVVAVLDCGVDASHPDLRGAITRHFNVTGHGSAIRPAPWDSHGTECAGLVAAIGRPGGLRGVAAGCGLYAIRTGYTPNRLDGIYVTKVSWQVEGIEWAWRNGADVLSMSVVGGPRATPVERALARARTLGRGGSGSVLVAAAGNDGAAHVAFPASAGGVLGVAATDPRGRRASFSNWGGAIDLAAPGVNVTTTTIPDPIENELGLYFTDSGTSLATPIVAGVAALVLAAKPTLRAGQVQALLRATASGSKRPNPRVGAGVVNAAKAVCAAQARPAR
jgi:subtilisin family serine protease